MHKRLDSFTEMIVNDGIAMGYSVGVRAASRYMRYWGVPIEVIVRVLFEPELRRS